MIEVLFYLGMGLVFLALLLLWVRRSRVARGSPTDGSEALNGLEGFQLELPPRSLGDRIFALQDWHFVASQAPIRIQRLFLQERKTVALFWLRQTREALGKLMDFHRRAARCNIRLSTVMEIRLAANYSLFLLVYNLLRAAIWLRGPYGARTMVGLAARIVDQLSDLSERLVAGVDPSRLQKANNDWPKRSVTV